MASRPHALAGWIEQRLHLQAGGAPFAQYLDLEPGRVSNEFLFTALRTMDLGASCDPINDYNTHCTMNKVLEYMAMGRPIVSFDLKEARVSAGDAAVYASANDEAEFAKLITLLLDDPEKRARMGNIGQERISGQLSWRNSQASLLAAYAAACRDHTPVSAGDPVRTGKRPRR